MGNRILQKGNGVQQTGFCGSYRVYSTSPKTVEDLLTMLVHTEQTDQEVRFLQGEIVDQLVKRGMNYPQISAYSCLRYFQFVLFLLP